MDYCVSPFNMVTLCNDAYYICLMFLSDLVINSFVEGLSTCLKLHPTAHLELVRLQNMCYQRVITKRGSQTVQDNFKFSSKQLDQ